MVELTKHPINPEALVRRVSNKAAGAVVLFLGTTRGVTDGVETESLNYECYPEMALAQMEVLERTARDRWPIFGSAIVHRLGQLEVGEVSVAVAVSTAHRDAAFEAGQWLIDSIKEVVPIWKREKWADGTSAWVHPGSDQRVEDTGSENRTLK